MGVHQKPPFIQNKDGPLYVSRVSHGALDTLARTFDERRLPTHMRAEDRKGLLLYQLRAFTQTMPPSLASEKAFATKREQIEAALKSSCADQTNDNSNNFAGAMAGNLYHLRNQAHKQCGVAQFGKAWAKDKNNVLLENRSALNTAGERAYPFYLVQHLADRIHAIGMNMLKDRMNVHEFHTYRQAMEGAVNQFNRDFSQLSPTLIDAALYGKMKHLETTLTQLAKGNKSWFGTWSQLDSIVSEYNQQRFLRSDPMAPGVREESTLASVPVYAYRQDRECGAFPTLVMGESPLLDVVYTARWAKLTRTIHDTWEKPENREILNDSTIQGNPDSHAVKELVRECACKLKTRGGVGS